MHFMAPVNLGNGKSNVVKSTPGVLFYSQDNSITTTSPVYASNKLEAAYFKMAPRTVNGNSPMQESTQIKRLLKPSNGSVNVSSNISSNTATMSNSEFPKSNIDSDTNGVCKVISSSTFVTENVSNNICDSAPYNNLTISSQTFGLLPNSNPTKPLSRVNSISHDDYSLSDLPMQASDSQCAQLSDLDSEYKQCISMHEEAALRLNSLQNQLKQLSSKCAHVIGKRALSYSKHLSTSNLHDNTVMNSILHTCAHELDSDETDSSSDEELSPQPAISSENVNAVSSQSSTGLSAEESWLCCRAVYHAQWQWLLFEIQHAEFALHNIRTLATETKSKIKQLRLAKDICPLDGEQCARTIPFKRKTYKQKVYRLDDDSPTVVELLSAGANGSCVKDGSIRCNCRTPDTGPCILCLGRIHRTQPLRPWSRLNPVEMNPVERALPLDSTVHYKLSSPADIPPSLVMELRLRHNLPPVARHWSTPYSISIPLPQLSPLRSPARPLNSLNLSASSTSSASSNLSTSKSVADMNRKLKTLKRRRRSHNSHNEDSRSFTTKRSKISGGAASRDGSSGSNSCAAIDSRRTSQDYYSETCPSPGLPVISRLTRVPCVDVELPGWREISPVGVNINYSLPSSQPLSQHNNHHTVKVHVDRDSRICGEKLSSSVPCSTMSSSTSSYSNNLYTKCANLRLKVLTEHSLKEDTSDEAYDARHTIEEENERRRVLGIGPGSQGSSVLAAIPSLRSTGRRSQSEMQLSYQPSTDPGYLSRHFPLNARDIALMTEEEEKEKEEILPSCLSSEIITTTESTIPNPEEH